MTMQTINYWRLDWESLMVKLMWLGKTAWGIEFMSIMEQCVPNTTSPTKGNCHEVTCPPK